MKPVFKIIQDCHVMFIDDCLVACETRFSTKNHVDFTHFTADIGTSVLSNVNKKVPIYDEIQVDSSSKDHARQLVEHMLTTPDYKPGSVIVYLEGGNQNTLLMKPHQSEDRLCTYGQCTTFEELLDLYGGCDIPQSHPDFPEFWKRLVQLSPDIEYQPMTLFRGTSLETLDTHGSGYIWTPDRERAIRFAHLCVSPRYRIYFRTIDKNPIVLETTTSKIIHNHTNDRQEKETFIEPPTNFIIHHP